MGEATPNKKPYSDKEWEKAIAIVDMAGDVSKHFCEVNEINESERLGVYLNIGIPVACSVIGQRKG